MTTGTPRGIRNNNPGNIRYSPATATYEGCTGQDDKGFCVFDTPEHGIQAMYRLLGVYRSKYGLNTVRGIISRWAPSNENDTAAYIQIVSSAVGVLPDDQLLEAQLPDLVQAMIQHENAQQPYTAEQISSGLGTTAPAPTAEKPKMPILAIISALGPLIAQFIPQVAKIFTPQEGRSEVSTRNLEAAQLVVDTIVKATGAPNIQAAVEEMKADPDVAKTAQAAVVNEPQIMALLEIGDGGIKAAREFADAQSDPNGPWWKFLANGAFWMGILLTPLIYMVVYRVLWDDSSEQLKTVVVTAILSGLLGAITGFWFGAAYTNTRTTPPKQ